MEGLSIKKTKKGKRVRELRKNPSRTKTGKVRTEGGGAQQFEVPRVPGRLKTALMEIISRLNHPQTLVFRQQRAEKKLKDISYFG
ncbi:hypothetical protein TNCV_51351 [Trichonephila clavipes]|nr:hypothetical protein TNCV_51351 [Trichonephila clavipes]